MAKFVVHKVMFHYNDEDWVARGTNRPGSVVSIHNNLEDAKIAKRAADITTFNTLKEDAFKYLISMYDSDVHEKLNKFYTAQLGVQFDYKNLSNGGKLNESQVYSILNILEIKSLHDIVEYPDDETFNSNNFKYIDFESDEEGGDEFEKVKEL